MTRVETAPHRHDTAAFRVIPEELRRYCRRRVVPVDEIVSLYAGGESEKAVASRYKVDRNVVRRVLLEAGITPRGRSEAMFLRMAHTTPDGRKALARAANEKMRTLPPEFHHASSVKQAGTKQRTRSKVGMLEAQMFEYLAGAGVAPQQQLAVDVYNIDIAAWPVAVEIHANASNPHGHPMYRKRIMYLLNLGWNVLYVKLLPGDVLSEAACEYAAAFVKQAQADPSAVCEYRMIRGSGQFVAAGRADGDDLAGVGRTHRRKKAA